MSEGEVKLSKNELKRRAKLEAKAKEKAAKEAAKEAAMIADAGKKVKKPDEPLEPGKYHEHRYRNSNPRKSWWRRGLEWAPRTVLDKLIQRAFLSTYAGTISYAIFT